MFFRPRLSRLWSILAGGVLLTLFSWAVHRNTNTYQETGDGEVSNERIPRNNMLLLKIVNFSRDTLSSPQNRTTITDTQLKISDWSIRQQDTADIDNIHKKDKDTPGHFQLHFVPLKYSTSELQTKLDALNQQNQPTMEALIESHLKVCSNIYSDNDNTSSYYHNLISSSLEAWYDFIPHHGDMLSSQCWYTSSFKKLKRSSEDKLSKWNSLYHIKEQYTKNEALNTISSILGHPNQRAVFENASRNSVDSFNTILCLPKVYLGGFPKCGTTALYSYLSAHPSIVEPYTKEGQFWREFVLAEDQDYRRLEVLLYLYHFKGAAAKMRRSIEGKLTLDASASTVFASAKRWLSVEKDLCLVPHLLSKVLPATKLIFILRDPVERLWSDYWYFCSKDHFGSNVPEELLNRASEVFHNHSIAVVEAFIDCLSQGNSEFECTMLAHSDTGEKSACRHARIGLSLYYFHVVRWLSVFPRDQLRFVTLEDLKRNPYQVLENLWRFLGISPLARHSLPSHVTSNSNLWIKSEQYRDRFKMWPETEYLLRSFFHPYNVRLAKLLKKDKFLWAQTS